MTIKEFTIYSDGNVLFTAENEDDVINGIFVHSSCKRITPCLFKQYKQVLKHAVEAFHARGLKVYATPVDEKDEKWIVAFGFQQTGLMLDGFKLLKHTGEL